MVFDETGERLTPTHAVKKGTRYRYYVSTSLITGLERTRSSGRRIPAGNLEGLVINRLRTFLADPGAILDAIDNESHSGSGCTQLIERGRQLAEDLGGCAPTSQSDAHGPALPRGIRSNRIDITLSRCRLTELLAGSIDLSTQHRGPANAPLRPPEPLSSARRARAHGHVHDRCNNSISLLKNRNHADGDSLLAIIEMEKTSDLLFRVELSAFVLEPSNADHLFQKIELMRAG